MDPAHMQSLMSQVFQQQQATQIALQQQQQMAGAGQEGLVAAAIAANPLLLQPAAFAPTGPGPTLLSAPMGVPQPSLGFSAGIPLTTVPTDSAPFAQFGGGFRASGLVASSTGPTSGLGSTTPSGVVAGGGMEAGGDEAGPGRRRAHIAAEQKRRNNIRVGFQDLQALLPSFKAKGSSQKLSKSAILYQSMDYINQLAKARTDLAAEVQSLRNEATVLKNLSFKYQQAVALNPGALMQPAPPSDNTASPEHLKFQLFRSFLEKLYATFDESVQLHDLETLSKGVDAWLNTCTREQLLEIAMLAVNDVSARTSRPPSSAAQKVTKRL